MHLYEDDVDILYELTVHAYCTNLQASDFTIF